MAFRRLRQDGLELVAKAEIQHPIGLVEHHRLEPARVDGAAVQVVEQATRSAHHERRATRERAVLVAIARTADHGGDTQIERRVEPAELRLDLLRELARRHDHERLRPRELGLLGREVRERLAQQEADGERLARARLRAHPHIASLELGIEHLRLDGRERRVALFFQARTRARGRAARRDRGRFRRQALFGSAIGRARSSSERRGVTKNPTE